MCMGACANLLFNSPGRKSFEKVVESCMSVCGPLCVSAEEILIRVKVCIIFSTREHCI